MHSAGAVVVNYKVVGLAPVRNFPIFWAPGNLPGGHLAKMVSENGDSVSACSEGPSNTC
jgi:hypothetical protein